MFDAMKRTWAQKKGCGEPSILNQACGREVPIPSKVLKTTASPPPATISPPHITGPAALRAPLAARRARDSEQGAEGPIVPCGARGARNAPLPEADKAPTLCDRGTAEDTTKPFAFGSATRSAAKAKGEDQGVRRHVVTGALRKWFVTLFTATAPSPAICRLLFDPPLCWACTIVAGPK
mmetsp:Transcript_8005/g.18596  ORF Transcript_8005/g.18596 Transcript_8005/m.18596 type:complete len:179 (+) Transcript_8005:924-1460(+)